MSDDSLMKGLEHGFIDSEVDASESFKPQLITNDPSKGEKVITTLKQEMETCDEFMFSVAFVNAGGVNALAQEFRELDRKGVKGRILVSQYQNFTEPRALKDLRKNKVIDLRIMTEEVSKMHTKCYIFRHGENYDVIIGSSNLTNSALCENMEWNLKFNSKHSGEVIKSIISEFEKNFEIATPVDELWIEQYSLIYDDIGDFRRSLRDRKPEIPGTPGRISPNRMQIEALQGIQGIRDKGGDRALVISATGSGKTYLSAFDAKIASKKFLYIVHRRPILNKSMESFEKVMEGTKTIAKFDVDNYCLDADCIFATIQTMSKQEVLNRVPADFFDYILIDEVHHAGAPTYQRVLKHFKPKFLLGMTATPERTDGFDIYKLFDYNIAYDIRLKEAMEYKLICPFHYFGIADLTFDDVEEEDKTEFLKVQMEQRIDHIISNAEYYGYCGDRLKGLVFCRSLKEAEEYSREFNKRWYKTCNYRTGWVKGGTDEETAGLIERLEGEECEYALDYIFTVDLFNEGVDIPAINQVIMLRPMESPIVFIQQLGRGLRHYPGKDYVVILDFIGNYEKNYNIPMALSDDRSYSKAETRRFVAVGDAIIPGNSTISFDEISKKKIYESIDRSNFTENKILKGAYEELKKRLGRIPRLPEYKMYGSIDAMNLLSKYRSYHDFLMKDKEYSGDLNQIEINYLRLITKIVAPGKRLLEVRSLELLLERCEDLDAGLVESGLDIDKKNIHSVLDGSFFRKDMSLIQLKDGKYCCSEIFRGMLENECFYEHVKQVSELGRQNCSNYSRTYESTDLVLNMRYTFEDICRYLNWPVELNGGCIGGYWFDEITNTFPVIVNYIKEENIGESQNYNDYFASRNVLVASSKDNRGRVSPEMKILENAKTNETQIHLFVRKKKNDGKNKDFYYLGMMDFVRFLNDEKPVEIECRLKNEVRADLYDYLNSE